MYMNEGEQRTGETGAAPPEANGYGPDDAGDAAIESFWVDAKVRARLNPVPAYMGVGATDSLRPPAWAFGATPEQADALLDLVLAGRKTATAGALADFEAESEAIPEAGTLGILLDGKGRPRALVETTHVRVVPFDEVDAGHARAEGEGDGSLDAWRQVHRWFFAEYAAGGFDPKMPVVLERFRVLVPRPRPWASRRRP